MFQVVLTKTCKLLDPGRHKSSRNHMMLTESATEQIQRQFFSAFPQIDANALNDIEIEAQYLAANLDGITENLCNLLHSVRCRNIDVKVYVNFIRMLFYRSPR